MDLQKNAWLLMLEPVFVEQPIPDGVLFPFLPLPSR
jgi:hypothetical protein